jgi:hypothetical protein
MNREVFGVPFVPVTPDSIPKSSYGLYQAVIDAFLESGDEAWRLDPADRNVANFSTGLKNHLGYATGTVKVDELGQPEHIYTTQETTRTGIRVTQRGRYVYLENMGQITIGSTR